MPECLEELLPTDWWKDKKVLERERRAHGSFAELSRVHGVAKTTLRDWWDRFDLPQLTNPMHTSRPTIKDGIDADEESLLEQLVLKGVDKLGDNVSLASLADFCDVAPKHVKNAIEALKERKGFRFDIQEDESGAVQVELQRVPIESDFKHKAAALFDGDWVRFGIVSDVHLGSKHAMEEELHIAYAQLKEEGVTVVYNPGDIVCGLGVYPGQLNDILFHTLEDQITYATKAYPAVEGITTHLVGGNHDLEGSFGRVGANPAKAIANQRDDIIYDGDYYAWYEFEQGTKLYVVHPKGGSSYAKSYKMQKFAESFDSGRKPNVLIAGHYHDMIYLQDRGIQMLKAGCFESNGNLGVRVPLSAPATGFWIIDMKLADDGSVVSFDPKWRPLYSGRKAR
jgi:predicted phosphodiesterase